MQVVPPVKRKERTEAHLIEKVIRSCRQESSLCYGKLPVNNASDKKSGCQCNVEKCLAFSSASPANCRLQQDVEGPGFYTSTTQLLCFRIQN
jgi:hypothetical protein